LNGKIILVFEIRFREI